jgi:multidrug resistance efflux pump
MAPIESPRKDDLSQLHLEPQEKRASSARRQLTLAAVALALLIGGLVALAIVVSDGAETTEDRPGAAARSQEAAPPPGSPARRDPAEAVLAGGYVEARRTAGLMPGRDGVVSKVLVVLGQPVAEGDLLLELDTASALAERDIAAAELELASSQLQGVRAGSRVEEVLAARSEADAAEADWQEARQQAERMETLAPSGATTAAEVDRARHQARAAESRVQALRARERLLRQGNRQSDVQAALANQERATASLRRAEALLELCSLRAPFGGTVVSVEVEPGEAISLQNGRPAVLLADLSEIWVRVDVPESRIAQVRLDAQAEVVVDALGDQQLPARVVEIAPVADRQSNTVSVAVRLTSPPPQVRPNMSARVSISSGGSS